MRGSLAGGLCWSDALKDANFSSLLCALEELSVQGVEDHEVFESCGEGFVDTFRSCVHAFERESICAAVSANGFTVVSRPWFLWTVVAPGGTVSAAAVASHISASEGLRARCS